MIQEIPVFIEFNYPTCYKNFYNVNTNIIPIIVDFGKSNIIAENKKYGFINPYHFSKSQDILSLIFTSVENILSRKDFDRYTNDIIYLMNFLSGTEYRKQTFNSIDEIKEFTNINKKYSEITNPNRIEFSKSPMDLLLYITRKYKQSIVLKNTVTDFYDNIMYKNNPVQVFEYTLTKTYNERRNTYINICNRILKCGYPTPKNKILKHYTKQTIYDNVKTGFDSFLEFQEYNNIKNPDMEIFNIYNNTLGKLNKILDEITSYNKDFDYDYKDYFYLYQDIDSPKLSKEIFEDSDYCYKFYKELIKNKQKLIHNATILKYKNIIFDILYNNGDYKLSNEEKFDIANNSVSYDYDIRNKTVNSLSFLIILKNIYKLNLDDIDKKYIKDNKNKICNDIMKYKNIYML